MSITVFRTPKAGRTLHPWVHLGLNHGRTSAKVGYESTAKGETFKGTEMSRRSVADLISKTLIKPTLHMRAHLGFNKPNTDGDRPSFY